MNKEIDKYIEYYVQLPHPPQYSILLKGKWGSGKTYYIKELSNRLKDVKFIYISLYGVNSIRGIEEKIFQAIHPILGSKGMKIAAGVVQSILKTTIKIDVNKDSKDDVSINSNLPEIDFIENFNKIKNKVLIFDDIERCDMKLNSVLGYINNLVENDDRKAILIANEDEILGSEDGERYLRIKEKLIGKTFSIEQNIGEAFEIFTAKIKSPVTIEIIKSNEALIKGVYAKSTYKNLRHLKRSLENFELFIENFPSTILDNNAYKIHLIELFFIISIELENGTIKVYEISKLFPWKLGMSGLPKDNEFFKKMVGKYPTLDNTSHLINPESWIHFFKYGTLNGRDIKSEIQSSHYFMDEFTPNWEKLWHFYKLEDEDFDRIFREVRVDLTENRIKDQFILTHVVGVFIQLAVQDLIDVEIKHIIENAKLNIDRMMAHNILVEHDYTGHLGNVSYGKQYYSLDHEEFQKFMFYLKEKIKISKDNRNSSLGKELMGQLKISVAKFLELITPQPGKQSPYLYEPVLKFLDIDIFVNELQKSKNENIMKFNYNFHRRYSNIYYLNQLANELPWLELVKNKIQFSIDAKPKTLKTLHLLELIDKFDDCIKILQKNEENNAAPHMPT